MPLFWHTRFTIIVYKNGGIWCGHNSVSKSSYSSCLFLAFAKSLDSPFLNGSAKLSLGFIKITAISQCQLSNILILQSSNVKIFILNIVVFYRHSSFTITMSLVMATTLSPQANYSIVLLYLLEHRNPWNGSSFKGKSTFEYLTYCHLH